MPTGDSVIRSAPEPEVQMAADPVVPLNPGTVFLQCGILQTGILKSRAWTTV